MRFSGFPPSRMCVHMGAGSAFSPGSVLVPTLPRGNPCRDAPASYLPVVVIAHVNGWDTGRGSVLKRVPTRERGKEAAVTRPQ